MEEGEAAPSPLSKGTTKGMFSALSMKGKWRGMALSAPLPEPGGEKRGGLLKRLGRRLTRGSKEDADDEAPVMIEVVAGEVYDDCLPACRGLDGRLHVRGHHALCPHYLENFPPPAAAPAPAPAPEIPKRKQIVFADDLTSDEEDASPAKGGDLWKESMF